MSISPLHFSAQLKITGAESKQQAAELKKRLDPLVQAIFPSPKIKVTYGINQANMVLSEVKMVIDQVTIHNKKTHSQLRVGAPRNMAPEDLIRDAAKRFMEGALAQCNTGKIDKKYFRRFPDNNIDLPVISKPDKLDREIEKLLPPFLSTAEMDAGLEAILRTADQ